LEQKIKPSSSNEIETKFETLQHDINLGINQIQNGDYTEYDDLSLPNLLETIVRIVGSSVNYGQRSPGNKATT